MRLITQVYGMFISLLYMYKFNANYVYTNISYAGGMKSMHFKISVLTMGNLELSTRE